MNQKTITLSLQELFDIVYNINKLTNSGNVIQLTNSISGGTGETMRTTWNNLLANKKISINVVPYESTVSLVTPTALPDVVKNKLLPSMNKALVPTKVGDVYQNATILQNVSKPTTFENLPIDIKELIQKQVTGDVTVPLQNLEDYMNSKALSLVCRDMYSKLRNEYAIFNLNLKLDQLINNLRDSVTGVSNVSYTGSSLYSRIAAVHNAIEIIREFTFQAYKHKIIIDEQIVNKAYEVISDVMRLEGLIEEEAHNLMLPGIDYDDNTNSSSVVSNSSSDSIYDEIQEQVDELLKRTTNVEYNLDGLLYDRNILKQMKYAFLAEFLNNTSKYVNVQFSKEEKEKNTKIYIKYNFLSPVKLITLKNSDKECNIVTKAKSQNATLQTVNKVFKMKIANVSTPGTDDFKMHACITYTDGGDLNKNNKEQTFADIFYENFDYIEDIYVVRNGSKSKVNKIIKTMELIVNGKTKIDSREDVRDLFKAYKDKMKKSISLN